MKRPIQERLEQWRVMIQDSVERVLEAVEPLLPRLPGIVTWVALTLCAGWLGGNWAAQSFIAQQLVSLPAANPTIFSSEGEQITSTLQRASQHELKRASVVGKPYLGIRGKEIRRGEIRGVKVVEVFPNSPAALAGLRADHDTVLSSSRSLTRQAGHIIIGANGQLVRSEDNLAEIIAHSTPGSILQLLVIVADGSSYNIIPVTLGTVPDAASVILTTSERDSQQVLNETLSLEREAHH